MDAEVEDWHKKVAGGLNLVYWGIGVLALSIIGGALVTAFSLSFGPGVFTVGILAGIVMGIIGRVHCLRAPMETGAHSLIVAAVVCDGLGLVSSILPSVVSDDVGIVLGLLTLGGTFLPLASLVLFVLFLKQMAFFLGQVELAKRSQSLVVLGVVLSLLVALFYVIPILMLVNGSVLALLAFTPFIGLVALILFVIILLRYVRVLNDLRQTILQVPDNAPEEGK